MAGGRLLAYGNVYGLTGGKDTSGREYELGLRVFEEVYGYASWKLSEKVLGYIGLDLFAQAEAAIVRPTILGGVEWRAGRHLGLQLEVKQMAFTTDGTYAAVDFIGPGGYGALAANVGFNWYFGSSNESTDPGAAMAMPGAMP